VPAAFTKPSPAPAVPFRPVTAWRTAVVFLAITALLGALLRSLIVWPLDGLNYAHLLHTHSHIAFLGWVFNAFFAVGLVAFVPGAAHASWRRLFIVLQIAVVGMLFSYPWEGYGPISITFSTLHMGAAVVFAWRLWRSSPITLTPAARPHLRIALWALVLSGIGPLVLGPLAAADLRDAPAYALSIYYYLHTHYNGWFLFFLQAVALQSLGARADLTAARRAANWLGIGLVLTFAQSTLWLGPPSIVTWIATIGGIAQLIGCGWMLRAVRTAPWRTLPPVTRALVLIAVASWLLKHGLQAAAAWPGLLGLVNHRFIVIAFLHLVFLGIVTPALLAYALHRDWLQPTRLIRVSLVLLLGGTLVSQLVLVGWPMMTTLPPINPFCLLAISAIVAAFGTLGLLRRRS